MISSYVHIWQISDGMTDGKGIFHRTQQRKPIATLPDIVSIFTLMLYSDHDMVKYGVQKMTILSQVRFKLERKIFGKQFS
jgi:hypothetical protein